MKFFSYQCFYEDNVFYHRRLSFTSSLVVHDLLPITAVKIVACLLPLPSPPPLHRWSFSMASGRCWRVRAGGTLEQRKSLGSQRKCPSVWEWWRSEGHNAGLLARKRAKTSPIDVIWNYLYPKTAAARIARPVLCFMWHIHSCEYSSKAEGLRLGRG